MITDAAVAPTIGVSIVLYESPLERLALTLAHLFDSLSFAMERGVLGSAHVRLVDNASCIAYQNALRETCAVYSGRCSDSLHFSLEFADRNQGFGAGHNQALAGGRFDYLLILNPDVELELEAVAAGVGGLMLNNVVALNPISYRADGEREYLCKRYPSVFTLFLRGFGSASLRRRFAARLEHYEYQDASPDATAEVELLSGACFFCRGADFRAVDGFDARFFMYFEDFDLSRRLAQRGLLQFHSPVRIVHHGGNAAGKGKSHIWMFLRSARRFFSTHGWRWA